jgi:hypothetical protein
MWHRKSAPGARELVAECEAFLAGRYVEHLLERGERVPAWAWTNQLAHGTLAQLRCPSMNVGAGEAESMGAWLPARSYLAGEVLDVAQQVGSLSWVQRRALVPLELELAARCPAISLTPSDWVTAVLAALATLTSLQQTRRHS